MKEKIERLAAHYEEASKSQCMLPSLQAAEEHRIRTRAYAEFATELRAILAEQLTAPASLQATAAQGLDTAYTKVTETVDAIAASEAVAKVSKVADKVTQEASEVLDGARDRASKLFGNLAERLKRDTK